MCQPEKAKYKERLKREGKREAAPIGERASETRSKKSMNSLMHRSIVNSQHLLQSLQQSLPDPPPPPPPNQEGFSGRFSGMKSCVGFRNSLEEPQSQRRFLARAEAFEAKLRIM